MADAEFRYADLFPAGADDTPYRVDLVAQGAQDPAVRLWVRLLVVPLLRPRKEREQELPVVGRSLQALG
jgi:hypothetical protein